MAKRKEIEISILQAIRDVVSTYQTYEENFKDEKYLQIDAYFIQPMISRANSLMGAFSELERSASHFSNEGITTEH